jgi:hypothetical protein
MVFVVAVLVGDIENDIKTAKGADGEAGKVDGAEGLILQQEAEGCFQIAL